jgi:hypothetical protein
MGPESSSMNRLLGLFASGSLGIVALICITDLNHPPGVRYVRLLAFAVILAVGVLEYLKPWRGVALALLLWPQWLMLREVFMQLSPLFHAWPTFQGGVLSSALAVAIWLRTERNPVTSDAAKNLHREPYSKIFLVSIITLSAALLASVAYFYVRHQQGTNLQWSVMPMQPRRLLDLQPLGALHPIQVLLELLLPLTLCALLVHGLRKRLLEVPWKLIGCALTASAVLVALETIPQILGVKWWLFSFNVFPPAGPFPDRNALPPILLLSAAVAFAMAREAEHGLLRWLNAGAVVLLCGTTLLCGSRNGFVVIPMMAWLLIAWRFTAARIALLIVLPVLTWIVLFYVPLPVNKPTYGVALQRVLTTVADVRAGNWSRVHTNRGMIYDTAIGIWKDYPATGSGAGTFYMQVQLYGPHPESARTVQYSPHHGHNAPLHFLAEGGPIAALAWSVAFLLLPAIYYFRNNSHAKVFAWSVLTVGMSNQLDHVWGTFGYPLLVVVATALFYSRALTPGSINGVVNTDVAKE